MQDYIKGIAAFSYVFFYQISCSKKAVIAARQEEIT